MDSEKRTWEEWMALLLSRLDKLDKNMEKMIRVKDFLGGDEILDNQDLCHLFGVTTRTLQRYPAPVLALQ